MLYNLITTNQDKLRECCTLISQKEIAKIPKLPYGQGNIVVTSNGQYLMYSKTINKKRVSEYGFTVAEVMKKMDKREKQAIKTTNKKDKTTLSAEILEWIKTRKKTKLKSTTSYDRVMCTWRNQIDKYSIGRIRYQQVSDKDIQNHLNSLIDFLSWSTTKKAYDLLNEFYRHQKAAQTVESNPMDLVDMPSKEKAKPEKEIEYLEIDDIKLFINEASKLMKHRNFPKYKLGFAFIFLIFTGLRIGEMIALRWKDIDFDKNTILINKSISRVINENYDENNIELMKQKSIPKYIDEEGSTKNYKLRVVPMNVQARNAALLMYKYAKYKDDDDFVIAVRGGGCNNITNTTKQLKLVLKNSKTTVTTGGMHILRHTCASLLFEQGLRVEIIASILGNSPEVCRETYVHFSERQRSEAISQIPEFNIDLIA